MPSTTGPRPSNAERWKPESGGTHGRYDMTFPSAYVQEAVNAIPSARVTILDDAGHMAHIDQPEAWLAAVSEFLT
jgi:pimeloyl-ACP methyl ester carboxylesterase